MLLSVKRCGFKILTSSSDWWTQARFEGSKIFIFISKLKILKEKILKWNKEHFNNIFNEKTEIEDKLKNLNLEIIKHGMNNESYLLEKKITC